MFYLTLDLYLNDFLGLLGITGITWDYFSGLLGITFWDYLGLLGITFWDYLGLPGITWDYLGLLGITWHYLGVLLYLLRVQVGLEHFQGNLFNSIKLICYV